MQTFTMPYSGRLLVTQLAAYGLAAAIQDSGVDAFVGHVSDPDVTPQVHTTAVLEEIAACICASAERCQSAVERNYRAGTDKSGKPMMRPAIAARGRDEARAPIALAAREALLDELEARDRTVAVDLVAGLGAVGAWMRDSKARKVVPHEGASRLDGALAQGTSDLVRSVVQPSLKAAMAASVADLLSPAVPKENRNRADAHVLPWSPPGTRIALVYHWLAALGLGMLPVGLSTDPPARTPGCWEESGVKRIALPVPNEPVSAARLRALLQLRDLARRGASPESARRLRALGVGAVVVFTASRSRAGPTDQFWYGPANRIDL